eukprot:TRINITY_DN65483_c0_g1_i1.p1 TRINITY_DN65483_c0_g1~~TRINITY_DN65483_c0_g1_i1.p1  ORF type:complete len:1101 (+),score=220.96 TRINITY_DN65483_c0_g1_i1:78-3305(+)
MSVASDGEGLDGPPGTRQSVCVSDLAPGFGATEKAQALQLPNGATVLLRIAEKAAVERADMVCAAVCLRAGQFDDPPSAPGLARVAERMMLCGSSRYPTRDLPSYCAERQGRFEADTSEHMLFAVDVPVDSLRGALDRLVDLLAAPLLPAEELPGVVAAIEEEHRAGLREPAFQQWQLLRDLASPAHPMRGFSTGSAETMSPLLHSGELLLQLRDWISVHTSAPNTSWCIAAAEGAISPDELHALALETIFRLPPTPAPPARPWEGCPPFGSGELGRLVRVLAPSRELRLSFPCPVGTRDYAVHATGVFSDLLGSHQPGSVLGLLRARGLAEGGWAGAELQCGEWTLLTVVVQLTAAGEREMSAVCRCIFQGAYMLRTLVGQREWGALRCCTAVSLALQGPPGRWEAARTAAAALARGVPSAEACVAGQAYLRWDPKVMAALAHSLVPGNCVAFVRSDSCDDWDTPHLSAWGYDVPYGVVPLSEEQQHDWGPAAATVDPELRLPLLDPRWAAETVIPSGAGDSQGSSAAAVIVASHPRVTAWLAQQPGQPLGAWVCDLCFDACGASALHAAALALAGALATDALAGFQATAARHNIAFVCRTCPARSQCRLQLAAHGPWAGVKAFASDAAAAVAAAAAQALRPAAAAFDTARCSAAAQVLAAASPEECAAAAALRRLLCAECPHGAEVVIEALSQLTPQLLAALLPGALLLPSRAFCLVAAPCAPDEASGMLGELVSPLLRGLAACCVPGSLGAAPQPVSCLPRSPLLGPGASLPPPWGLPPMWHLAPGLGESDERCCTVLIALCFRPEALAAAAPTEAGGTAAAGGLTAAAQADLSARLHTAAGRCEAAAVMRCEGGVVRCELTARAELPPKQMLALTSDCLAALPRALSPGAVAGAQLPCTSATALAAPREAGDLAAGLGLGPQPRSPHGPLAAWLAAGCAPVAAVSAADSSAAMRDAGELHRAVLRLAAHLPDDGVLQRCGASCAVVGVLSPPAAQRAELEAWAAEAAAGGAALAEPGELAGSYHWRGLAPAVLPSEAPAAPRAALLVADPAAFAAALGDPRAVTAGRPRSL